ncbi:MAG: hypothetical protein WBV92_05725 [Nitrosotalea sp.]
MKLLVVVKKLANATAAVVAPAKIADVNQATRVHSKPSNEVKIFFFFRVS